MKRQYDMNPLLKISFPFVIGIITSNAIGTCVTAWIWLTATILALALSFALYKNKFGQSLTIYIIIFMLGGYLTRERLSKTMLTIPDNAISYEAVVFSEPVETNKAIRCDIIISDTSCPIKTKAIFHKDSLSETLNIGDGIIATSIIKMPENVLNSSFDYTKYLRYHNYAGTTYINSWNWQKATIDISHLHRTDRAKLTAMKLRAKLLRKYAKAGIKENNLQIISAMTLGEKSLMTKETKEAFSVSGASHILALSGLHLSIIYAVLMLLMGRRKQFFLVQSMLMITIWTFVFIVGMPPSAVRAAIMLTTYSFTSILNRDKVSFNTLALAAIIILMCDQLYLYDTGFQMSFMAVLFILLLYQPIYRLLPILHKNMITRYLWQITSVSIAAQTGVIPLIAFYFGRISCYSLITNIIVVPAAMIIICGSIAVLILSPITPLQHFAAIAVSKLTEKMSSGITFLSSLPYSSIDVSMSAIQTIMFYLIIFSIYIICKSLMPRQSHEL